MFALDATNYLDRLLDAPSFRDFGPNGLQVPNTDQIEVVATGVSASAGLFERAAAEGAKLVLVHHGLFWDKGPRHIDAQLYGRLKPLFAHGMALAAYHLPLDGHPEHGNNALLAEGLGCDSREPYFEHGGRPIGMVARFDGDGIPAEDLRARVRDVTQRDPLHLAYGPARVRTVGIVSGAAADSVNEAIAAGHDAFLTGEPAERVMATAREAGIHFFAAGHYATETFGPKRLGELLSRQFGVTEVFIDDPNPI